MFRVSCPMSLQAPIEIIARLWLQWLHAWVHMRPALVASRPAVSRQDSKSPCPWAPALLANIS